MNSIEINILKHVDKDKNAQAFFDYNLRNALGLDPDGTDFINVDAIDPEFYAANGNLARAHSTGATKQDLCFSTT